MRSASRSRLGLLLLLLVFASGLGLYTSLRGVAQAAGPRVWLSQKVGPPTTSVQVNGAGFGHSEMVRVDQTSPRMVTNPGSEDDRRPMHHKGTSGPRFISRLGRGSTALG